MGVIAAGTEKNGSATIGVGTNRDVNSGTGTGMIFYPQVAPVPDPNRDGYGTDIFFHPRVTRRVPDTLLPL
jgi:hypothetical protein